MCYEASLYSIPMEVLPNHLQGVAKGKKARYACSLVLPTHLRGMAKGKKARYACSLLLAPLVTCTRWGVSR